MANTFKNRMNAACGTSNTTCYVTPSGNTATIIGMCIANRTTNQITIDAYIADFGNGNAETYLANSSPVPAGGSLVVVGGDQKVVMEAGDRLDIRSSAASSADVVVSILEIG